MTALTEASETGSPPAMLTYGATKFLRDVWTVLEMKSLFILRGWFLWAIRPLIFPLGILFWLTILAPGDPESSRRILTGALIFGFSLSATNMLTQQLIQDRFLGRLKLIITLPVSKAAYCFGVLAFATMTTAPIVILLLGVAPLLDVDFELTWVFFPLILPTLFIMGGITFVIASYAPSMEAGSIMGNIFGVVMVIISPVFFTMDQAPVALRWLGWVSPMRYAADGVMKSLSGQTDVWLEFLILIGFATVITGLGLWKMKWREY
ncbi:ABC transporter permease [SAR202 cluster bacterium AD-802-F09_MRT_200m]|nr:ABC transporter permease [SAR202 cluster bacterium AD-802-F09_MRT_200m]